MRGQWLFFRTMVYFIAQGIACGVCVGLLMGTLIVPVFGSFYGAVIGGITGFVLGIFAGIGTGLLNRRLLHEDTRLVEYRRRFTTQMGLVVLILLGALALAAFLVAAADSAASVARLRVRYPEMSGTPEWVILFNHLVGWLVIMAAYVIPIALAIAYTASHYADGYIAPLLTKKNEDVEAMYHLENPGASGKFMEIIFRKALWMLIPGALVGMVLHYDNVSRLARYSNHIPNAGDALVGLGFGAGIGFLALCLLIVFNNVVLSVVNRIFFDEYARHWPLARYQRWLMIILGGATLIYGVIPSAIVLAPLSALVAALSAREYARWHYGSEDKRKHVPDGSF